MNSSMTLAITGDSIINRRVSVYHDDPFVALIKVIREADVSYTHLETLIHDYDGPEIYPAAHAGGTWMRSPRYVLDELKWAGFDIVSCAANHTLDYSYGGLFSTIDALNEAGLPHAGIGRNLAEAREPAYLDTEKGRIALISMCSSFASWGAAGEARRDIKGRPGLNPLRYYYMADKEITQSLKKLCDIFGFRYSKNGKVWLFGIPGIGNQLYKVVEGKKKGVYRVAEEADVEGNLISLRDARQQADYVLVHLHTHEWECGKAMDVPARFVSPLARRCIDEGADAFIGQGAHMLRGVEIYKSKPIFYDINNLFSMSSTTTKLPSDYYWNESYLYYGAHIRDWDAVPSYAFSTRSAANAKRMPKGPKDAVKGSVVAVCTFDGQRRLTEMKLYPVGMIRKPRSQTGRPLLADGEEGKKIITYFGRVSARFGTKIDYKDGVGYVRIEQ